MSPPFLTNATIRPKTRSRRKKKGRTSRTWAPDVCTTFRTLRTATLRARGSSTMAGEAAGDGCGPELA
eukprot:scaffold29928_cov58-Phaeocystis_antarctica.AAC.1